MAFTSCRHDSLCYLQAGEQTMIKKSNVRWHWWWPSIKGVWCIDILLLADKSPNILTILSVSWEHRVLDENWPQRLVLGIARPLHHHPQHLLPSQGHNDPQVAHTWKQSPKTIFFGASPLKVWHNLMSTGPSTFVLFLKIPWANQIFTRVLKTFSVLLQHIILICGFLNRTKNPEILMPKV